MKKFDKFYILTFLNKITLFLTIFNNSDKVLKIWYKEKTYEMNWFKKEANTKVFEK